MKHVVLMATLCTLAAACVSPAGGGRRSSSTEKDAADSPPVKAKVPQQCLSKSVCANQDDCEPGERCNTTQDPPLCHKLYCSKKGESCDPQHDDLLCETGLVCNKTTLACDDVSTDGTDAVDGTDGLDGVDATDGLDGVDGTEGLDGID